MIPMKDQVAILENRINVLENRGKTSINLINSLKRELKNKKAKLATE